jgi:hypothetical protein
MCVSGVVYGCPTAPPLLPFPPTPIQPPRTKIQIPEEPPEPYIPPPMVDLYLPSTIAFNMDIYYLSKKILPASEPIWLEWIPRTLQASLTTRNPYVCTSLRFINYGGTYVTRGSPDIPLSFSHHPMYVLQLAYINQRWIVALHEVFFEYPPSHPSVEDLAMIYNNRKEKLINFYDSYLNGLNDHIYGGIYIARLESFSTISVSLHTSYAVLFLHDLLYSETPLYTVQPTSSNAYAMFIYGEEEHT